MKRVFRIIGRLNIGGPAIHTILLTHLLDREQFDTTLITGIEGPAEGSMRYLAEERGVAPHVIPEMGREISWREDIATLRKLIALMRRHKPDVIHTHTAKAGTLGRIAALLALPGRRKRIYHTFHGHVFHGYFSERKSRAFVHIERFLARYTHRIIAVSERTRQELLEYSIAPPEKILFIPNGFDLAPFATCATHRGSLRAELGLPEEALLVGVVARLVPIKGLHEFLEATRCLAEAEPNAHFVLVGDGELRSELEAHADTLDHRNRIHFLGFRSDLPRIYADLDMVVLSSHNEGLPVSLVEAMASGCVVVATDVGGVPDLVRPGETGFLAPAKNPAGLANALLCAFEARDCWPVLTARARESVLARYHINRLVADIERLYTG